MEIDVTETGISKIKNIPQDYTRTSKARCDQEVEICNVDFEQVDGDNIFNIEATVFGNYDDYIVHLKLRNNLFEDASCTCPDYDKGNTCKHILATCLEVEHPHKPSMNDKLEEFLERQRVEAEERHRQYLKEKEEEKIKKVN